VKLARVGRTQTLESNSPCHHGAGDGIRRLFSRTDGWDAEAKTSTSGRWRVAAYSLCEVSHAAPSARDDNIVATSGHLHVLEPDEAMNEAPRFSCWPIPYSYVPCGCEGAWQAKPRALANLGKQMSFLLPSPSSPQGKSTAN
jgi:hypothetical protein